MSTTTASPGAITRSDTSWCGLAPFGPLATMTKSTVERPAGRAEGRDLRSGLAHPQLAEHRSPRSLGDTRHGIAQREHLGRPHVVVECHGPYVAEHAGDQ